ncbi:MAG: hypothetical protein K2L87_05705, partial [Clostridiales bacterium]|nr:hypothetical protein [Clostridiales bacterium]
MKKLLTATLAIAMGATLVGALAACKTGANDEEMANRAISTVRSIYGSKADEGKETPQSYTVTGVATLDGKTYTYDWSVNSSYENYANYVSVAEELNADKTRSINITKAPDLYLIHISAPTRL